MLLVILRLVCETFSTLFEYVVLNAFYVFVLSEIEVNINILRVILVKIWMLKTREQ